MSRSCLRAAEISAFIESGRADATVSEHLRDCKTCQIALDSLENEVLAMQYSISGLWFRERISCPTEAELANAAVALGDTAVRDYIDFHTTVLGCRSCVARDFEAKSAENPEVRRKSRSVQQRVTDSMGTLFRKLGGDEAPPP